jgi:hypothetical protein
MGRRMPKRYVVEWRLISNWYAMTGYGSGQHLCINQPVSRVPHAAVLALSSGEKSTPPTLSSRRRVERAVLIYAQGNVHA